MRKLANPPAAIKLVLEAVCVVLDIKPVKACVGVGSRGCSAAWDAGATLCKGLAAPSAWGQTNVPH
jgi:hypothetical protein